MLFFSKKILNRVAISIYLQWASLTQPAPTELPQDWKVARVSG